MHIPDGFLDAKTLAITGLLSAGGLAIATRHVSLTLPRKKIPLMGLGASFVFAAQMLNFPVAGGTSGHLLGGVLAGVLLGPEAAAIVIASVLAVQALLFSDGGLLALGANIFNMAFVGAVGGSVIYRFICKWMTGLRGSITAVFFASWLSTVMASAACAGELAMSGTLSPGVAFSAMIGIHALIGIGEGLITSLVILTIARTRPDLISTERQPDRSAGRVLLVLGLVIALGLAVFVSPYACSWPDGLDKVSEHFGFNTQAKTLIQSWIADYKMPGISSEGLATAIAGAIGTLVMFGLACVIGRILVRDKALVTEKPHIQPPNHS